MKQTPQQAARKRMDLKTDVEKGQSLLWGNECEGMCGV